MGYVRSWFSPKYPAGPNGSLMVLISQDMLGSVGICQDQPGSVRTDQDPAGPNGYLMVLICQDMLGSVGICQDQPGSVRISQD